MISRCLWADCPRGLLWRRSRPLLRQTSARSPAMSRCCLTKGLRTSLDTSIFNLSAQRMRKKCLFSNVKLNAKNYELRVARAYGFGENEETDKKIFIKVVTSPENTEEMETTINV